MTIDNFFLGVIGKSTTEEDANIAGWSRLLIELSASTQNYQINTTHNICS